MSEYTTGLRAKLDKTTDYVAEYEKMFGGYEDRKLAKDDLYYSIKNEIESKEKDAERTKKKKDKLEGKKPGDPLLPVVHESEKQQLEQDLHKQEVKKAVKEMEKDPNFTKEKGAEIDFEARIEKHKMAFQGDFEKLDDEIKCQLRAIQKNDFDTIKKLHA